MPPQIVGDLSVDGGRRAEVDRHERCAGHCLMSIYNIHWRWRTQPGSNQTGQEARERRLQRRRPALSGGRHASASQICAPLVSARSSGIGRCSGDLSTYFITR
jgi:hypothetical protein